MLSADLTSHTESGAALNESSDLIQIHMKSQIIINHKNETEKSNTEKH